MTVLVYLRHGSFLQFDNVEKILSPNPNYIGFHYQRRDGIKGHAVFNTQVIAGYAKEGDDDKG